MMNKEEIEKLFKRIELDKSSDSCGFEFADGFSCTFDNVATCYDDRLKLYELVKNLQRENEKYRKLGFQHLNEQNNDLQARIDKAIEYIEKEGEHTDCSGEPIYYLDEEQEEELLEILGGKE